MKGQQITQWLTEMGLVLEEPKTARQGAHTNKLAEAKTINVADLKVTFSSETRQSIGKLADVLERSTKNYSSSPMVEEVELLRQLARGEERDLITAIGDLMYAMRDGEKNAKSEEHRREVHEALSVVFEHFGYGEEQKTPVFTVTQTTPVRSAGK